MASINIPEFKVILCGEYGVGKSSLFRRFAFDVFVPTSDKRSTLGLDNFSKVYYVGNEAIKLQLWDTGGIERVASVTSSYYKFAEAAILVFSSDNANSFHVLSQYILDVVTYAENAKIFLCSNKEDMTKLKSQVDIADVEDFCEQCHNLISATYRISCKTGSGIEDMFSNIAERLVQSNRSRLELQRQNVNSNALRILNANNDDSRKQCSC